TYVIFIISTFLSTVLLLHLYLYSTKLSFYDSPALFAQISINFQRQGKKEFSHAKIILQQRKVEHRNFTAISRLQKSGIKFKIGNSIFTVILALDARILIAQMSSF
ncbi:MAG TPA: hypothetical protein DCW73_05735, partial [Treponema sp.]|nr:hypothetical protein [Treponema sp.]